MIRPAARNAGSSSLWIADLADFAGARGRPKRFLHGHAMHGEAAAAC